ncbi:MAG: hypothetical protein RR590_00575 [Hungatella sp.]
MAKQPTFFQLIEHEFQKELKDLKRQKLRLKMKLLFTFVFPVVIMLLFVQTVKIYIDLKLKKVTAPEFLPKQSTIPQPVAKQVFTPEFLTPQPVSTPIVCPTAPTAQSHITITDLQEDA